MINNLIANTCSVMFGLNTLKRHVDCFLLLVSVVHNWHRNDRFQLDHPPLYLWNLGYLLIYVYFCFKCSMTHLKKKNSVIGGTYLWINSYVWCCEQHTCESIFSNTLEIEEIVSKHHTGKSKPLGETFGQYLESCQGDVCRSYERSVCHS